MNGTQRQADEGAAAPLWQLLMVGEVPVMAYFGIRWVAAAPEAGLIVLIMQVAAALLAAAPVFVLEF